MVCDNLHCSRNHQPQGFVKQRRKGMHEVLDDLGLMVVVPPSLETTETRREYERLKTGQI